MVRYTARMAYRISPLTLFSALVIFNYFSRCDSAYEINKCCSGDEQLNSQFQCSKISKRDDSSSVVNNRLGIDIEYDKFNFSTKQGVIPCSGSEFIVKPSEWFKLEEDGSLILYDEDNNPEGKYSKESYCVERWNSGSSQLDIAYLCPCIEHLCISKCCQVNMQMHNEIGKDKKVNRRCGFYDKSGEAEDWEYSRLNGTALTRYHEIIYSMPNCDGKLTLELKGKYSLLADGSIDSESDGIIASRDYCGDFMLTGNNSKRIDVILACVDNEQSMPRTIFVVTLSTVAEIFLLLTIVLHLWLPELAGLHARCLVAHTACSLLGLICITFLQLSILTSRGYTCYILGYLMQFSFLASFFWLNIMCVDMSYTFSALRPTSKGSQRERDRRKFMWYSVYAWGCTAAFTLAAIIVDFTPAVPASSPFKPNLGVVKCWFNSSESLLVYFYGPMGILLLANLFLFVYTTWRIIILSRGSDALHHGDSARHGGSPTSREKQRYILYAKMFSLMGVTWLTEILSWAVGGPSYIWYFTDSINLLRAVFIFLIFCWKPRVWAAVKKKFAGVKEMLVRTFRKEGTGDGQPANENSEPSTDSSTTKTVQSTGFEMKSAT